MFLTKDEVHDLTGYTQPAAQRRWLVKNGYSFDVRGDGRPAVLRQQLQERHKAKARQRASGPNLAALDELQ